MSEKKAVLHMSPEKAKLDPVALMGDITGINFIYQTDFGAIANMLPSTLEPAFPFVSGYVYEINKPSIAEHYREAMLGVYVKYQGNIGMYPFAFLLSGPGAEMATYTGHYNCGLAKKMCGSEDCIKIERDGDVLRGTVDRKGVRLLDVSLKLGEYNDPITGNIYGNPGPGSVTGGTSYYFWTCVEPDSNGAVNFTKVHMLSNVAQYTYRVWKPGKVTVRTQSSIDDPWGELPVLGNMGGSYSEHDLEMKEIYYVASLDPAEAMPKLISTRFDHTALVK